MKTIIILLSVFAMTFKTTDSPKKFYDFTVNDIRGKEVSLEQYKGKVVLVVNTASKCGYTPQYKDLQAVYEQYKDDGFVILGFPANEFGGQEPGSNEEIAEFCQANFGVSFPMFSKVVVKGEGIHPLFDLLTTAENPDFKGAINWNFEKFLIDKEGNLVRRFRSRTNPTSKDFISTLETFLK